MSYFLDHHHHCEDHDLDQIVGEFERSVERVVSSIQWMMKKMINEILEKKWMLVLMKVEFQSEKIQ